MALSTALTHVSEFHLKNCKTNLISEKNVVNIFPDSISYLKNFYKTNVTNIESIIEEVVLKSENYKIIELDKNIFLMITKKDNDGFKLQLGYPFEIFSKQINNKFKGYEIRLCLCSEIIRTEQRKLLASIINAELETVDIKKFKQTVVKSLKNSKSIYSINLFNYIGDTLISSHYTKQFEKQFKLKIISSFSRFKKHISNDLKNIKDLDLDIIKKTIKSNSLIIMPDIIDAHFISSVDIINTLLITQLTYFLPGRNMLININPGRKNKIIHLACEDPLLSSGNIEDHMNDCLESFIPDKSQASEKNDLKFDKNNMNILIAPFASAKVKEMSLRLVKTLIMNLDSKKVNNIFISCGYRNSKNYKFVKQLLKKIKLKHSKCTILEDNNLSELSKKIEKNKINLAFTCDSAIASLVTYKKITNFTIYFSESWDSESKRSMAGESPIGFCRYSGYQIPLIINKNDSRTLINPLNLIKKLKQCNNNKFYKTQDIKNIYKNYTNLSKSLDLEEFLEYYNPLKLLKNVKNLDNRTIDASVRISPLYKLKYS